MRRPRYRAICRHCEMVLFRAGARLGRREMAVMRDHLRVLHPGEAVPETAPAGAIRAHYRIELTAS